MDDILKIPSSQAIKFQSLKQLPFICNSKGDILEWKGVAPSDEWHFLLMDLFKTMNLFSFFDMKGAVSLEDLDPAIPSFHPKTDYRVYDNLEYFYSVLPIVRLRLISCGNSLFFGLIMITDALPNYFPEQANSLFHMDRHERLVGFNQSFYDLFQASVPSPRSLIGRPVPELFSPSPGDILKGLLQPFAPGAEKDFVSHFSMDFRAPDPALSLRWFGNAGRIITGEGLEWDNTESGNAYLTLFPEVDLEKHDIEILADITVRKGHAAILILGCEREPNFFPYGGMYLAGRHGTKNDYVIKREGYVVAETPAGSGPENGTYSFARIGRTLHFGINGRTILSYHNPVVPQDSTRAVSLGLRPGCACTIRRVQCRVRPATPGEVSQDHYLVRLKHDPSDSFLLTRFFGPGLHAGDNEVQGYMLQNVTGLQRRFENLEHDYANQVKRGRKLESLLKAYREEEGGFVGNSPVVAGLKTKVRIIADSNATVLIQGQTGTGKEVLARFIHDHSPYREGPFIKVDCSTLPRTLLESELFGHEKGSFTGAVERKAGLFERADRGTLFLDEVGNFSPDMQVKLLQFLQDFTVTRVGGTAPLKLNLRVVAAANVPLLDLVRQGQFREDLYYRLFVVVVDLPPLKDRKEDIPELSDHFLRIFAKSLRRGTKRFSAGAFRKLLSHGWPGNVRELKNVIQRAVLLSPSEEVNETDIELEGSGSGSTGVVSLPLSGGTPMGVRLRDMSDARLHELLDGCRGNVRRLALELKVSRRALYYQIRQRGIDLKKTRPPRSSR